jgi:hypothetical protein
MRKGFDPNQPRDKEGQWAETAGVSARKAAGLSNKNDIVSMVSSGMDVVRINKDGFMVVKESTEVWDERNGRYKSQYTIHISPDYNPSADFKIVGRTIDALVKKLQEVEYRIVKPNTSRG